MSPREKYNSIAKEMGVTEDKNVPAIAQLSFAREQANQMKLLVNRFLFDITIAKTKVEKSKDRDTKSAAENKVREYEAQLAQTLDGLTVANELVKELEKEVE